MSKADLVNAHNEGYNRGYAKAQEEIEQLKAQIEKMKCCRNCKYQVCDECGEFCDYKGISGVSGDCDKWELKE